MTAIPGQGAIPHPDPAAGSSIPIPIPIRILLFSRAQPVIEHFRTFALTEQDALAFGRSWMAASLKLARMISRAEIDASRGSKTTDGREGRSFNRP